jgi:hypothetical protein
LGMTVLAISLRLCATTIQWSTVGAKLGIAAVCVALSLRLIPLDFLKRI